MRLKFNSDKNILLSNQLIKNKTACDIHLLFSEELPSGSNSIVNMDKIGNSIVVSDAVFFSLGNKSSFKKSATSAVSQALVTFLNLNKLTQVNLHITPEILSSYGQDEAKSIAGVLFDILSEFYICCTYRSSYYIYLEKLAFTLNGKKIKQELLEEAIILIEGYYLTRDLGNGPANAITPQYLADLATSWAKISKKVSIETLGRKQISKLGMNSFLAVAKGAEADPKLITLQYNGKNNSDKPVVLVGKGVTFDCGGISLKDSLGMENMKMDMCGAATVLACFVTAVKLELPINLVVVVAATENMISGTATRPGDVVTSMSGKTIEIVNTDAEGRLILCDALTYVKDFNPKLVIDVATLTGACVVALGHTFSAVYSNDEQLLDTLVQAGKDSSDRVWPMPSDISYKKALTGGIADLCNVALRGSKTAGSCIAAAFLQEFVDYPWAHLDIAGSSMGGGSLGVGMNKSMGSTGRPYKLLMEFLTNQTN